MEKCLATQCGMVTRQLPTLLYRWRTKYGGLEASELQRLRELEAENARLKKIVAQQALDIDVLKEIVSKEW